jgi:MFS family permease
MRLLLVLCLAQLMVVLDITAVNVALPDLADGLRIDGSNVSWAITSYSLVFGSLLLLGGRAADLLGRRRVFLTGLAIFTVASVASALAAGAGGLFAARAFQGLGVVLICVSVSVMTGAPEREAGMLSGLNTTGHEIGGSIGIAILATVATGTAGSHASSAALANGISDGFLASGCIAAGGALIALLILPSAATFLPKLRLAPRVAVH